MLLTLQILSVECIVLYENCNFLIVCMNVNIASNFCSDVGIVS